MVQPVFGTQRCREIDLQNNARAHSSDLGEGNPGHDIRTEEQIRSKIGYMPEYDALNPKMDAITRSNIAGKLGMNQILLFKSTSGS